MNWIKLTKDNVPPENVPVLLCIDGGWIEGYRQRLACGEDEYNVISLNSHGCGCCADNNPPPTHWTFLPKPPEENT